MAEHRRTEPAGARPYFGTPRTGYPERRGPPRPGPTTTSHGRTARGGHFQLGAMAQHMSEADHGSAPTSTEPTPLNAAPSPAGRGHTRILLTASPFSWASPSFASRRPTPRRRRGRHACARTRLTTLNLPARVASEPRADARLPVRTRRVGRRPAATPIARRRARPHGRRLLGTFITREQLARTRAKRSTSLRAERPAMAGEAFAPSAPHYPWRSNTHPSSRLRPRRQSSRRSPGEPQLTLVSQTATELSAPEPKRRGARR